MRAAAVHPVLPLLALGTGSYDGGYFFEGALTQGTGDGRVLACRPGPS
ncbi:hypothetical protein [Streptomyces sp. NPDC054874]